MTIRLGAVRNLISQVKKLDSDSLMKKVLGVSALQQDILDLNRIDQLYNKGITADGVFLGEYSPVTIQGTSKYEGKIQKGQRYDHITLNDTGKFYSSFRFDNNATDFIISADTQKPDVDLMTYGNILGLTPEDKGVVCGWIRAPFINHMKSAIWK